MPAIVSRTRSSCDGVAAGDNRRGARLRANSSGPSRREVVDSGPGARRQRSGRVGAMTERSVGQDEPLDPPGPGCGERAGNQGAERVSGQSDALEPEGVEQQGQPIGVVGRARSRAVERRGGAVPRGIPRDHPVRVAEARELIAPGFGARADPVQQHQCGTGPGLAVAEPDVAGTHMQAQRTGGRLGRRVQFSMKPPLTGSTWPVTKPALSLSMNTTAPTTSSGNCARGIGTAGLVERMPFAGHVLGGFASHETRGDRVDRDPVRAQLARERPGHRDHRPLAGDVVEQARRAPQRGIGCQVDHPGAGRRAPEQLGQGTHDQPGAAHVDRHHPVPGVDVDLLERPPADAGGDGGVVDQPVDAPEFAREPFGERGHGAGTGDVRPNERRPVSGLGERRGGGGTGRRVDVGHDHGGAFGAARLGERPPEPAAAAGDDHDTVTELPHRPRPGRGARRLPLRALDAGQGMVRWIGGTLRPGGAEHDAHERLLDAFVDEPPVDAGRHRDQIALPEHSVPALAVRLEHQADAVAAQDEEDLLDVVVDVHRALRTRPAAPSSRT